MVTSPRLGFSYLTAGQAVPEVSVNELAAYLESGANHFTVIDRDLAAPPGSPVNGDTYLVAASPTGSWAGKTGKIAYLLNTAWIFITVREGMTAWVNDEDVFIGYDGAAWNVLSVPSGSYVPVTYLDTDGTLGANSDTKLATQKAVKTFVTTMTTGLLEFKGSTDCSANPNYPAASKGDTYIVSVAGKIGGASGAVVDIGDTVIASADNAGGTQAAVGASWFILEHNLIGAVVGSALQAANNLSDVASTSAARTNLGLAIGSNVQAWDADLDALAALVSGANQLPYFTGAGAAAVTDFTAAGRALIDDADASAQRTTLGLGTVATLTSDNDATLAANSATAVATQQAVKAYADALVQGLSWKRAVRAATTATGTLATAFANGSAIDGVTLATGDRILLKNQATGSENGIYIVAASGAPARASDADAGSELVNATCYVSEGSTLADSQWTCSTNAPITPGATSLAFVQLATGGGGLLASNNLSDVASVPTARTNLGLLRLIAFFFTTTPTASEVLGIYVAADAFTIPADMAGAQVKKIAAGANPAATFAINVLQNGTSIGTISISTGGVVTLTTTSGTAKSVAIGDVIHFVGPGTADVLITNWSVNVKGVL